MSKKAFNRFEGATGYVVSEGLREAVNLALCLERPLLLKGEPGTGKTVLAGHVAEAIGLELIRWHVKSTTKAQDGLYVYDTVARLHDSRFGDHDVRDIEHYIKLGPLGRAFSAAEQVVLLIDEVDKADLEFPNDLLNELDLMRFTIHETGREVAAEQRPLVVITSNNEKELPDAFLRRCVFHFIEFPDPSLMREIVRVHHPDLEDRLLEQSLEVFYALRGIAQVRKPPSTSELIDWLAALRTAGVSPDAIRKKLPMLGALLKKEQDVEVARRAVLH
jgi:MoxR-like ATPase